MSYAATPPGELATPLSPGCPAGASTSTTVPPYDSSFSPVVPVVGVASRTPDLQNMTMKPGQHPPPASTPTSTSSGPAPSSAVIVPQRSQGFSPLPASTTTASPKDDVQPHPVPRTPAGMNASQRSLRISAPISTPTSSRMNMFPDQNHGTMAEFAEAFRLIMNEGQIDAAWLSKLMRAHGQLPTDDEVRDIIKAIDQKGDGVVRFNDFAALMALPVALEDIDDMKAAFLHLDPQRKGYIFAADFIKLFALHGEKFTPEECEEMLRFADPDETGKVNYNLFLSVLAYRTQPRL
jgi:calmodulin